MRITIFNNYLKQNGFVNKLKFNFFKKSKSLLKMLHGDLVPITGTLLGLFFSIILIEIIFFIINVEFVVNNFEKTIYILILIYGCLHVVTKKDYLAKVYEKENFLNFLQEKLLINYNFDLKSHLKIIIDTNSKEGVKEIIKLLYENRNVILSTPNKLIIREYLSFGTTLLIKKEDEENSRLINFKDLEDFSKNKYILFELLSSLEDKEAMEMMHTINIIKSKDDLIKTFKKLN